MRTIVGQASTSAGGCSARRDPKRVMREHSPQLCNRPSQEAGAPVVWISHEAGILPGFAQKPQIQVVLEVTS